MALIANPVAGHSGTERQTRRAKRVTIREILAGIYHRLREMYRAEGGKGAETIEDELELPKQPDEPHSEEVAKEQPTQRAAASL